VKPIRFHLSIEHIWGLTALVGILIFINTHPIRPYDFWWHITIGREILTTGKIPTFDIYSYTANGQAYPSYQMCWLMEIFLYSIYKIGGPALVVFIHSLIITSAYAIIFWICKITSKSWRIAAFGVLFAAALGINDWNVRPQGITFLLASLFLLAIYKYQENRQFGWLIIFPLGMLIWVNSHGTFVIGLVLMSLWLGQIIWDLIVSRKNDKQASEIKLLLVPALTFGLTLLICLINPRGLGIINYLTTLFGNSVVQNLVTEWAPPTLNSLMGLIFYSGLIGSIVVFAFSPKRPNFFQISTFLAFGLLGVKTARGSVWFGMVMAPIIAEHISYIIKSHQRENHQTTASEGSKLLNITFCIVLIGMAVITLPWFKDRLPLPQAKAGLISTETPIQATQVLLEKNPPGQLFNGISFGSYLIWAAYPKYQVFVDSRIELFPEKVWIDYLNISNATGDWEELLKGYGVNILMLSPIEQPALVKAAQESGEWEMQYQDPTALIFVRRSKI
jgi:hypothetical protein